jgi:hypothetical protein
MMAGNHHHTLKLPLVASGQSGVVIHTATISTRRPSANKARIMKLALISIGRGSDEWDSDASYQSTPRPNGNVYGFHVLTS